MGAVCETGPQLDKTKRLTGCMGKQIHRPYYSSVGVCNLSAGPQEKEGARGAPNSLADIHVCICGVPWMHCQQWLALALEVLHLRFCT